MNVIAVMPRKTSQKESRILFESILKSEGDSGMLVSNKNISK